MEWMLERCVTAVVRVLVWSGVNDGVYVRVDVGVNIGAMCGGSSACFCVEWSECRSVF